MFRYDAELFYANANRFVDDVQHIIEQRPRPGPLARPRRRQPRRHRLLRRHRLGGLLDFLASRQVTFAVCHADTGLLATLRDYDLLDRVGSRHYDSLDDALDAFHAETSSVPGTT